MFIATDLNNNELFRILRAYAYDILMALFYITF